MQEKDEKRRIITMAFSLYRRGHGGDGCPGESLFGNPPGGSPKAPPVTASGGDAVFLKPFFDQPCRAIHGCDSIRLFKNAHLLRFPHPSPFNVP